MCGSFLKSYFKIFSDHERIPFSVIGDVSHAPDPDGISEDLAFLLQFEINNTITSRLQLFVCPIAAYSVVYADDAD